MTDSKLSKEHLYKHMKTRQREKEVTQVCKTAKKLMVRGDNGQEHMTDEAEGESVTVCHQSHSMLSASIKSNLLMWH